MTNQPTMETTLGDLIVALTEETNRVVKNSSDANLLVAYMLWDLLNQSTPAAKRWH